MAAAVCAGAKMVILVAGIALWILAHMFKRLAPGARAAMQDRMGDASKGVIAVALVVALVLIVTGYRGADLRPVYQPPSWGVHLNNLVMFLAIALFGLGNSKSRLRRHLRHPMLLGTMLWAGVHLLVNGDLASLVLFGSLFLWAGAEMLLLNRAVHAYVPFDGGSLAGDLRLAAITVVLFAIITAVHAWLGVWPFPGGMA